MSILAAVLCVLPASSCRGGAKKTAKRDEQAARILALDAEIGTLEREMNRQVPDVADKTAAALNESRRLEDALAKGEAALGKSMEDQRTMAEQFEVYRKKYIVRDP